MWCRARVKAFDDAAMVAHNLCHKRETKTPALGFGGDKRIKDMGP